MATTQSRYQKSIEVVLAAAPPGGWPADKYTTPAVIHLPAREGPYILKVLSGDLTIAVTFDSRQDVLDAVATWEDWPHGAVSGVQDADVLEDGEAIRITATADAVVQIMGVRS